MMTNNPALPIPLKPKRLTISVSPEYADGRVLILTRTELAFFAQGILTLEETEFGRVTSVFPDIYDWAEATAKELRNPEAANAHA